MSVAEVQTAPASRIALEQHLARPPGSSLQPGPPHAPHAPSQHTAASEVEPPPTRPSLHIGHGASGAGGGDATGPLGKSEGGGEDGGGEDGGGEDGGGGGRGSEAAAGQGMDA